MDIKRRSIKNIFGINKSKTKRRHFLVIGAGKFGYEISSELIKLNQKVSVIDVDQNKINKIGDVVDEAQVIDATKEEELENIDFEVFDLCIVSIGQDLNNTIMALNNVVSSIGGKEKIHIKCFDENQESVLSNMGFTEFIRVEKEVAGQEALRIAHGSDKVYELNGGVIAFEFEIKNNDSKIIGNTVEMVEQQGNFKIISISTPEGVFFSRPKKTIEDNNVLTIATKWENIDDVKKYLKEFGQKSD